VAGATGQRNAFSNQLVYREGDRRSHCERSRRNRSGVTLISFAKKGSQRWLQVAIDLAPALLDAPICVALGRIHEPIEWLSPLREQRFREFRDQDVITRCRVNLAHRPLRDFWPTGGPVWDGLARCGEDVILLEAKAHIPELVSPRTQATEPARGRIKKSMEDAQLSLSPKSIGRVDWTGTFYQYANRIAHLQFLREHNRIRAHLVNVYFLNAADVGGPTDVREWQGAIQVVNSYLRLGRTRMSKYTHDVFVDVQPLARLVESDN
jgi:hypothetical protein